MVLVWFGFVGGGIDVVWFGFWFRMVLGILLLLVLFWHCFEGVGMVSLWCWNGFGMVWVWSWYCLGIVLT